MCLHFVFETNLRDLRMNSNFLTFSLEYLAFVYWEGRGGGLHFVVVVLFMSQQ